MTTTTNIAEPSLVQEIINLNSEVIIKGANQCAFWRGYFTWIEC